MHCGGIQGGKEGRGSGCNGDSGGVIDSCNVYLIVCVFACVHNMVSVSCASAPGWPGPEPLEEGG